MIKQWFQNRSIFAQLLIGAFSILAGMALLWSVADVYFLRKMDQANFRRWTAMTIAKDMADVRGAEKDFMLTDVKEHELYETGDSPNLRLHAALLAQLMNQIDNLSAPSDSDSQTLVSQLHHQITTYRTRFQGLVAVFRERGLDTQGAEGEWEEAMQAIVAKRSIGGEDVERHLVTLVDSRGDYLLDHEDADAAAIASATAAIATAGRGVPGLTAAIERLDKAFGQYVAIQKKIGNTNDEGLQGELHQSAHAIEPLLTALVSESVHDAQEARQRLTIATVVILLSGLALAAFFFYSFARALSQTTDKLGNAATEIGRGHFNVRIDIVSDNELGRLAAAFNHMTENLAALIGVVQRSGVQINTSAMEIAATSRQQQATAHEIAATTTHVGGTAKEISATSRELATNVKEVATVAERTAGLASEGHSGLARMEATMRQIVDASSAVNARLSALSEKAGNINAVVTTISKVADQTNLLSLNAAIEAEKAGEYGRGFAVVATEIRRLADQTAGATGDIEQIIKEMQSAVTAGVMGMDKFSDEVRRGVEASDQASGQLSEIIRQVQALTPLIEMVNDGMQSQANGAHQISEALSQLGSSAQQTAESLVQSNAAIEQLNDASRNLQAGVSRFTVRT